MVLVVKKSVCNFVMYLGLSCATLNNVRTAYVERKVESISLFIPEPLMGTSNCSHILTLEDESVAC